MISLFQWETLLIKIIVTMYSSQKKLQCQLQTQPELIIHAFLKILFNFQISAAL